MTTLKVTAADTKLLALAWQCLDVPPKIDLKKLASLGPYKNPASANACWWSLKKKLSSQKGQALNLTPADVKLLTLAWQCFDAVPKVDVNKLAEVGDYKTAASANSCWYALKKKISSAEGGSDGGKDEFVAKRSAVVEEDDDGESDGLLSSMPKKRNARKSMQVESRQDETAGRLGAKVGRVKKEERDEEVEVEAVQPRRSNRASSTSMRKTKDPQSSEEDEEDESTTAIAAEVEDYGTVAVKQTAKVKLEEQEVAKEFVEQMMKFV